jgi:hypothetical protein
VWLFRPCGVLSLDAISPPTQTGTHIQSRLKHITAVSYPPNTHSSMMMLMIPHVYTCHTRTASWLNGIIRTDRRIRFFQIVFGRFRVSWSLNLLVRYRNSALFEYNLTIWLRSNSVLSSKSWFEPAILGWRQYQLEVMDVLWQLLK